MDGRTKTIMVRVTPQEKRRFKLACVRLGKSMSDALRDAMVALTREAGRDE